MLIPRKRNVVLLSGATIALVVTLIGCASSRESIVSTSAPTMTSTPMPLPALSTPTSTFTPIPSSTPTAAPTATPTQTSTSTPTSSPTPLPTSTSTSTPLPTATATHTPEPTLTNTPAPTNTPVPLPTNTPVPTATPLPTDTAVPAQAVVVISHIYFDGQVPRVESDEYAEITNTGNAPINIGGWRLNAGDPGQDFGFPGFDLQEGQSCRVYTNEAHPESCGFSFGIGRAIWNNKGDCGYLYDAGGAQVDDYCY
jgi:hypothetical protein